MAMASTVYEAEAVVTGRRRLVRLVRGGRGPALLQWRSQEAARAYEWQPEAVHEIVPGETSVQGGVQGGVLVAVADLVPRDPSHVAPPSRITRRYIFSAHNSEGSGEVTRAVPKNAATGAGTRSADSSAADTGTVSSPTAAQDRAYAFLDALESVGVVVTEKVNSVAASSSEDFAPSGAEVSQASEQPTPSALAIERGRQLSRVLTLSEDLWSTGDERPPLAKHFELEDILGEGGFANVYRAVHRKSGAEVAVKIMLLGSNETAADQRESLTESSSRAAAGYPVRQFSALTRVPSDDSAMTIQEDDVTPPSSPAKLQVNTNVEAADQDHQVSPATAAANEHSRRILTFEWEIRVMRRIRDELAVHPNLMRLYAVCTAADPPRTCLVMEKLDGGELFERIVERKHFTEKDAAHLFRTLIRALHELHRIGIVHRDLKPENIIFTDDSHYSAPKIADFGTAFLVDAPEEDPYKDKRIGSPGYSAPEVNKLKYTPACDVWSMGVLLYTLLCGYLPFPEGFMQIIKVMTGQFEFHEDKWAGISDDAKDLVKRMLTVSLTGRITTAEILEHPWLEHVELEDDKTGAPRDAEHPETDLGEAQSRMRAYILRKKFKSAATAAVFSARMRLNRLVKDKTLEGIRGRRRGHSRSSETSSTYAPSPSPSPGLDAR